MGMVIDGEWIDDDEKYRNPTGGAFVRANLFGAIRSPPMVRQALRWNRPLSSVPRPVLPVGAPHTDHSPPQRAGERDLRNPSDRPRVQLGLYPGIDDIQPGESGVLELHEVYIKADPNYTGRVTVPTLWDRQKETIVNNESSEIIRMLTEFDEWAENDLPDLYPEAERVRIDELNERIYETVNTASTLRLRKDPRSIRGIHRSNVRDLRFPRGNPLRATLSRHRLSD